MTAAFLSSTVAGGFVMRRRIRWTHSSDVALAAACGVGLGHVALGVALLLLGLSAAAWGLIFIGLPFALIAVPLGVFGATLATLLPPSARARGPKTLQLEAWAGPPSVV